MNQTEIRKILSENEIQLTKSLGQNFLHDKNQLRRIVAAAELKPADKVLEIGPGLGPLTELLVKSGASVLAVETDRRLCDLLQTRFSGCPNLQLLHEDALRFLTREPRSWKDWKVVSNLPYSIASPLLVEFAQMVAPPKRLVVTLQSEVAERLAAEAGNKEYGLLTLLVQQTFVPVESFQIPAGCFFPPPRVDSACLTLRHRDAPLMNSEDQRLFVRIIKRGFSQRRKMLAKLLKAEFSPIFITSAFNELGLSLQLRAEALTLEQFVALTKTFAKYRAAGN